MEFKVAIPYDIIISASHNKGYIVKVGCCITVFKDGKELLNAMEEYLADPDGFIKQYNEATNDRIPQDEPQCSGDNDCEAEKPTLTRRR